MAKGGLRGVRGFRLAVLVASALLHAALFAVLAHNVAEAPNHEEARTLEVSLVSPPPRPRIRRNPTDPSPPKDHGLPGPTRPENLVSPVVAPASAENVQPAPGDALRPGDEPRAGPQRTLRGLGGCDQRRLTREEREQCETQAWSRAGPDMRLNLDPTGRFAKNPEPFLSRRPDKGCRIRLTGEDDPRGDDMNARAGVTCVKRF